MSDTETRETLERLNPALSADLVLTLERQRDAARAEIEALTARAEKAERACKTLGGIVDHQCRDIAHITGSEHMLDEDGDGDWGAIWERGYSMAGRLSRAEAEVARLRSAVETVLAGREAEMGDLLLPDLRALIRDVRAALAPVEPSGETESGEGDPAVQRLLRDIFGKHEGDDAPAPVSSRGPHPQFDAFKERVLADPETRAAYDEVMASDPVSSGGQADGEGARLRDDERDAIALAKHRTWHVGCAGNCGGTLDDRISVGRELVPTVERIVAARLAARPVLSREVLRERLVEAIGRLAYRQHFPDAPETPWDVLPEWATEQMSLAHASLKDSYTRRAEPFADIALAVLSEGQETGQ